MTLIQLDRIAERAAIIETELELTRYECEQLAFLDVLGREPNPFELKRLRYWEERIQAHQGKY